LHGPWHPILVLTTPVRRKYTKDSEGLVSNDGLLMR
jgi:hypothetical protein